MRREAPAPPVARAAVQAPSAHLDGDVLGRVEIARLGVRAIVREGVDDGTLRVAVGHIPGTARPGEPGNVGLAGHRDTFFRALRNVRKGDVLTLTTLAGTETFRVASLSVVEPGRTELLRTTRGNAVTLVTCFPFDWIGAAPKRYVVEALPSRILRAASGRRRGSSRSPIPPPRRSSRSTSASRRRASWNELIPRAKGGPEAACRDSYVEKTCATWPNASVRRATSDS